MRIFGPGYRQSGEDTPGENPRVRRFKRKYSQGDVIEGTVLEYDSSQLAWVLVDDIRILAWTRNNHFLGRLLHLQVESMHPEIVLKEIEYGPEGKKKNQHNGITCAFQQQFNL